MKTSIKMAFLLLAGAVAIAGCGGSDASSEADTVAINELVVEFNRANAQKDGAAVCGLLQPSTFSYSFSSKAKCASETSQILELAGRQPELVVEDITIDGNTANVSFAGRSGEAPLVKEGNSWYLALDSGSGTPVDESAAGDGSSGEGG
ncbi:MAG: hypothetical protein WD181_05260 [Solirubrobacterales bacterium]